MLKIICIKKMHKHNMHFLSILLPNKVTLLISQWSLLRNMHDSIDWITKGSNISPFFIRYKNSQLPPSFMQKPPLGAYALWFLSVFLKVMVWHFYSVRSHCLPLFMCVPAQVLSPSSHKATNYFFVGRLGLVTALGRLINKSRQLSWNNARWKGVMNKPSNPQEIRN